MTTDPQASDLTPIERQALALAKMVVTCNASLKRRLFVIDLCTIALEAAYQEGRTDEAADKQ